MKTSINPVITNEAIAVVAELAAKIWVDHYTPIIGIDQVSYMLRKFQSTEAIQRQIAEGQQYYLAEFDQSDIGYASLIYDPKIHSLMISKIYTLDTFRGKGIGNSILEFIQNERAAKNASRLWLTVNKKNVNSIAWYQRHGFVITEETKVDIGGGFYMDDYVMTKYF